MASASIKYVIRSKEGWARSGGRNSRRCPRAVPVSGLSYIHHHMTIHTMQYGGVFQPTIQFPWLPSLPRALLRCARYLTSITRPALCIPRATRCNNLRAIPNRSSNVLAYQGLGRGWIPNRNWSMIRLRSQWWWSSTWSNVSKLTDCWVVVPVDSLDQLHPILKWDWIYFLKLPFILTIISSNRSPLCYGACSVTKSSIDSNFQETHQALTSLHMYMQTFRWGSKQTRRRKNTSRLEIMISSNRSRAGRRSWW